LKNIIYLACVLSGIPFVFFGNAFAVMYDGTKAAVSITLEHATLDQLDAINNYMNDMNATIAVIVERVGNDDYMTQQQLLDLQNDGHEIASHSQSHNAINETTPEATLYYEVVQSKIDLENMGLIVTGFIPPRNDVTEESFALTNSTYQWTQFFDPILPDSYPEYNTIQTLEDSIQNFGIYHQYSEGVGEGPQYDLNTVAEVKARIDEAITNKRWVALKFHEIVSNPGPFGTTPEKFQEIIQYIREKRDTGNLLVVTRAEGVGLDQSISCEPPPSGEWVITSSCVISGNVVPPGDVTIQNGVEVTIKNDGILEINSNNTLNNNGIIFNNGIIENNIGGTIIISNVNSSEIVNQGVISNYGSINNLGTINNSGTIHSQCESSYFGTIPDGNPIIDACVSCTPSGVSWTINESCQLSTSTQVSGNVVIQNNSTLIIPNGKSLDIDFDTKHLMIKSGSKVLIKSGGKIH
jgi:peptidoglycan/xylan/chitin deacetylase (PgdA/CDA1 family)